MQRWRWSTWRSGWASRGCCDGWRPLRLTPGCSRRGAIDAMSFAEIPLLFVLGGLVLYVVLGGADFGAPLWQVTAGHGRLAEKIREHAHNSMAPVWEPNHVWLIFVLTVLWTAYPPAFGSIASTLAIALTAAAIGIIGRGAAYALRSGTRSDRELKSIDMASAVSSVLAPFALGAAVGGIACGVCGRAVVEWEGGQ